jgi:hypothetical protein
MTAPTTKQIKGLFIALLGLAMAASGCASVRYGVGSQPYAGWFMQSEAARDTTFRAARRVVEQLAPSEIEVTEKLYRLTAVVNSDGETRDLLTVEVHERGEVMIEVRTELRDGAEWIGGVGICDPYDYGRERALGQRIVDYASSAAYQLALADPAHRD